MNPMNIVSKIAASAAAIAVTVLSIGLVMPAEATNLGTTPAPGMLEINHFHVSNTAGVWRIPTATDHTIYNAKVIVTLPDTPNVTALDPISTNAGIKNWGPGYAKYTWSPLSPSAMKSLGSNTYEVDLGTLQAGTGTVYQFNFTVPQGTDLTIPVFATAKLTGTYAQGVADCAVSVPPAPAVNVEKCQMGLAGQAVFPITAGDITVRDKWDDLGPNHLTKDPADQNDDYWRKDPISHGTVNADGWGAYPDRTLRLYGEVNIGATDTVWTYTAAQGFTFANPGTSFQTATYPSRWGHPHHLAEQPGQPAVLRRDL